MKTLLQCTFLAATFSASVWIAPAVAQTFPSKPVRMIVPFPAGGAVDIAGRVVGQKVSETWKQPVLVENRAGAGGNIGAEIVSKAAPDGHTLLLTSNALALSPSLYRKLPYDASKDFLPLVQFNASYLVLVVDPKLPVRNVKELLDLAKAKPGALSYGSTGIGVAPHLVFEQMRGRAGVDMLHVPYKGDTQVAGAIMAGDVQAAFLTPASVLALVKSGKLRAVGVTRLSPVATFEGVRPIADTLPGLEYSGYVGLYAPAATPRDIAAQIQRDVQRALTSPDVQEKLAAAGFEAPNTPPAQFAARYHRDIATFSQVVRDARIPPQE
jgi:tripartite-type tricarboxylate transporter receptor subunit TctC